jgi:uncharacterized caspase-like protein/predicted  nucleic acid-binding Zn-ribbon protein
MVSAKFTIFLVFFSGRSIEAESIVASGGAPRGRHRQAGGAMDMAHRTSLRRRLGRLTRWLLAVPLAVALAAIDAPPAPAATNADDLLIVDCLLPGKIRRLGTRVTYMTARRAVKTTAGDCAIRGGEYTSFDRADYTTALKVWLPLANDGDAEAQNAVGEIYEKGLGVAPQYDLAAQWYAKAAAQNFNRAQLNLGALYEKGLGVPRDPAKALELFRRASGLDAAGVAYVPASVQQEIQTLRSERDQLKAERDALRNELNDVRRQMERSRSQLQKRSQEIQAQQNKLSANRVDLEGQRQRAEAAGDQAKAKQLEAELAELRKQAAAADAEIDQMRSNFARLNAQASRLESELERERAGGAAARAEAAEAKAKLASVSDRLMDTERALVKQRRLSTIHREEIDGIRAQLEREKGAAQRDEVKVAALQKQLDAREAELADNRAKAAELSERVAKLEVEAESLRELAETAVAAVDTASGGAPVITILDPPVQRTRAAGLPEIRVRAVGERLIVGKVEAPAGLVALLVNDREEKAGADGMFRTSVPVQFPQTKVSVVAVDKAGQRAVYEFALLPAGEPPATAEAPAKERLILPPDLKFGRFFALVIGNNDYRHLPKLQTAVNDARAVSKLLRERYGFQVTTIENADRYAILSALNELRENLTEEDNLLIYYAGHGELDRVNQRGNWLPVDAEPNSTANWISNIQITDVLNAMSARHVLVVADSCYSGTLTRAAVAQLDAGMSQDLRIAWLRTMVAKRSRVVLSSGGVQPVLDSGGGDHSLFAKAFLAVVRENDGVLEGQRLFREVSQRVAGSAAAAAVDQVPQYAPIKFAGHEAGDFFLIPAN